jgi:hypothetical protein
VLDGVTFEDWIKVETTGYEKEDEKAAARRFSNGVIHDI